MSKLILIRGLPGSGKSTLARALTNIGYKHLEADIYHINPDTRKYEFDPKNIKSAHIWCQTSTKKLLDSGKDVVVSNTFTQLWEMQPYIDMGHSINILVAKGNFESVHNVPADVLNNMAQRWED